MLPLQDSSLLQNGDCSSSIFNCASTAVTLLFLTLDLESESAMLVSGGENELAASYSLTLLT